MPPPPAPPPTYLSLSPPVYLIFRRPCTDSLFYCYRKWAVDLIFNASRCHWVNKTWWGKNESEKPRKSQTHLLNCFVFLWIQRYIQTNIHPNLKLIFSEKAIELQKKISLQNRVVLTDVKKYETFFKNLVALSENINFTLLYYLSIDKCKNSKA